MSSNAAVKRLINGREGRGVSRYMLEEVYFSEVATEDSTHNPQNARYEPDTGRWYFNFPDMWYNNLSNNKAIGLRKIDVVPRPMFWSFRLELSYYTGGRVVTRGSNIILTFTPQDSTDVIMQSLSNRLGQAAYKITNVSITFDWSYDWRTGVASIELLPPDNDNYSFNIINMSGHMQTFFHCDEIKGVPPTATEHGTIKYTFSNIWNRQFAFLHASFVTGTSFNYLGRSGEFYPKPSKMYPASHSTQQFYFELSFDGRTPVKFKDLMFMIDLAYIYYDKDYNAE